MLTSFIRPARPELLISFAVLALLLFAGRFLVLAGSTWNVLASVATAVIFGVAATRLRAVRGLDVPTRTWFTGLLGTALLWAAGLGLVGATTAIINQNLSPYYARYDDFLVTSGAAHSLDTNGITHFIADGGQNLGSMVLTFLVYCSAFLAAAAAGSLVGLVRLRGGTPRAGLTALGLLVGLFFLGWFLPGVAYRIPGHEYQTGFFNSGYAEVFLLVFLPAALLTFLLAWWAARRVEV